MKQFNRKWDLLTFYKDSGYPATPHSYGQCFFILMTGDFSMRDISFVSITNRVALFEPPMNGTLWGPKARAVIDFISGEPATKPSQGLAYRLVVARAKSAATPTAIKNLVFFNRSCAKWKVNLLKLMELSKVYYIVAGGEGPDLRLVAW